MLTTALLIGVIALYAVSTAMLLRYIKSYEPGQPNQNAIKRAFGVGILATGLHLVYAYFFSFSNHALDFSLSSMAVLISGLLCFIYVLGGLSLPIRRLGVMMFPLTIICLLFAQVWGKESIFLNNMSVAASAHIIVSILAYCLLAIASVQAILYVYQEKQIKSHATPAMLMALPPLQTMEVLLFRLVLSGFVLLTLTLLSGAMFSKEIFDKPFEFNHHTILALIGWCVFAILLIKRAVQGLRGSQAVYWTIGGFLIIQLGYFGTKIVSETLAVQ